MCLRNDAQCSYLSHAQEEQKKKKKTMKSGSTDFGEDLGPRVPMMKKRLPKTKTSVLVVVAEAERECEVRMVMKS